MTKLATTAPDAKLLVAQTAAPLTATSTPSWEFLIGSPKTDVIYAVMVSGGKSQSQVYGSAGLKAAEWAAVPTTDAWKIDSNVAHEKAVALNPDGKSAAYIVGFVTYIPKSAPKSSAKPMVWSVSFDPTSKGKAPTTTVDVDMSTGVASWAK